MSSGHTHIVDLWMQAYTILYHYIIQLGVMGAPVDFNKHKVIMVPGHVGRMCIKSGSSQQQHWYGWISV